MTDTTEALVVPLDRVDRRKPRWHLTPGRRETVWGYVFISPWLFGPRGLHGRPDDRGLHLVADELRPDPSRVDPVHRPRQLHPDGQRPERREGDPGHVRLRRDRDPADDALEPDLRRVAQQPATVRPGHPPDALLHAVQIPLVASTLGLGRVPQHRDGLAERDPRILPPAAAGLDQQRGLDLPGPRDHRPVGRRQLHADQPRRHADGPRRSSTRRPGSTAPGPGSSSGTSRSR
jgi:hypothetical protein